MTHTSIVLPFLLLLSLLSGCVGSQEIDEDPAVDVYHPPLPSTMGEAVGGREAIDASGTWHYNNSAEGLLFFMQAVHTDPGVRLQFTVHIRFEPNAPVEADGYTFYTEPHLTSETNGHFISIGGMSGHSDGPIGPVAWSAAHSVDADVGYVTFLLYTPVPGHLELHIAFDDTELRPWEPLVHEVPPVEQEILALPPGEEVTRTFEVERPQLVHARLEGSRPVAEEKLRVRMDQHPYGKWDHRGTQDPEDPIPYTLWADGAGYTVTMVRPLNLLAQYDGPATDQRLNVLFVDYDLSAAIEKVYGLPAHGAIQHFREY